MKQVILDAMPIVVGVGIALAILAALLIFQELKPLTLRNPEGDLVPVAKDADAATALLALALDPANPELKARADAAREQRRVLDLPNRTRVNLVGRRFYKNGRLLEDLTLRSIDQEDLKKPERIVEQVKLLPLEYKGLQVWVESKYCKKKKLPF